MIAEIFGADGLIVAVIAVAVFFGAQRLPEMARSFGRAQGEFRKGVREGNQPDEETSSANDDMPPEAPPG